MTPRVQRAIILADQSPIRRQRPEAALRSSTRVTTPNKTFLQFPFDSLVGRCRQAACVGGIAVSPRSFIRRSNASFVPDIDVPLQ